MRLDNRKAFPAALQAMLGLEDAVHESTLEPELLELVKMRASQLNGCAYCLDMHSKDARARGESEQRLHVLAAWREAPFYSRADAGDRRHQRLESVRGRLSHGGRRLRLAARRDDPGGDGAMRTDGALVGRDRRATPPRRAQPPPRDGRVLPARPVSCGAEFDVHRWLEHYLAVHSAGDPSDPLAGVPFN